MARMTETALRGRARVLLEAMTERARWIYALPRVEGPATARAVAATHGLVAKTGDGGGEAGEAGTERFASTDGKASIVVFDSEPLDVAIIEATGADAVPVLGEILEKTDFYAQSTLLGTALDTRDVEAPTALRTLAYMVVGWDEDWSELFALHLGAPDDDVRSDAVAALLVAARVARDAGPAATLLADAIGRESSPELKATMTEALGELPQVPALSLVSDRRAP